MQKKMIGNAFSATIKDRNFSAGSAVSHRGKGTHYFYYDIYYKSDDSERTSLVCELPKVEHGLRRLGPGWVTLQSASGFSVSLDTMELVKQEITLNSLSLLPVIANNSRAICWLPDKRIRPSSASWWSGHHPEAINGVAQWWKATCQRRVYDVSSQALPQLELNCILLYSIYFVELFFF